MIRAFLYELKSTSRVRTVDFEIRNTKEEPDWWQDSEYGEKNIELEVEVGLLVGSLVLELKGKVDNGIYFLVSTEGIEGAEPAPVTLPTCGPVKSQDLPDPVQGSAGPHSVAVGTPNGKGSEVMKVEGMVNPGMEVITLKKKQR
ncbi:hypothetical protein H920_04647 [Fukomys damarensis]|uniref:Uncharacterized protein n=1 Tax=Fukomys damarensis TaxID=885580 RepID=A0A091EF41_FUKDA|nr:hypothetical protein H920_04647 [Fukomys damarensis]